MKRHLPFQTHYIWTAILLGIFGGFLLGALLVYSLTFTGVGSSYLAAAQVHGHLQLLGWTGLFIVGVSLFKLPRLMSSPSLRPLLSRFIFGGLAGGLLLRSIGQLMIAYSHDSFALRLAVAIGCLFESCGMLAYFLFLIGKSIAFETKSGAVSAASIKPFLIVGLIGWFCYALINAGLGISYVGASAAHFPPYWNNLAIETYVHFVLLPYCFAFSISTFPIFLRLRAPTWPVARVAALYGVGASAYLLGLLVGPAVAAGELLVSLGVVVRVAAMFWLLYELDLVRRERPWFRKFRDNYDRENHPPRRHAGDYGQFGNFEWLIYAAYGWLALAAVSELLRLWPGAGPSPSVIRHFYLLGFVTHLILGMGVRLVTGFLGQSSIASPALVRLSFVLILAAAIGRTLPLIYLPQSGLLRTIGELSLGFSGVMAILAVAALGVNLFISVRREKRSISSQSSAA